MCITTFKSRSLRRRDRKDFSIKALSFIGLPKAFRSVCSGIDRANLMFEGSFVTLMAVAQAQR